MAKSAAEAKAARAKAEAAKEAAVSSSSSKAPTSSAAAGAPKEGGKGQQKGSKGTAEACGVCSGQPSLVQLSLYVCGVMFSFWR